VPSSPNPNTARDQIVTEDESTLFYPASFLSCSLRTFFAESRARLSRQMRNRFLSLCSLSRFFDVPLRGRALFSSCHIS
jgi:hypothetical protein